eukprot:COSAG05_NODE_1011_length_6206_cov_2.116751_6_plen_110_part_00
MEKDPNSGLLLAALNRTVGSTGVGVSLASDLIGGCDGGSVVNAVVAAGLGCSGSDYKLDVEGDVIALWQRVKLPDNEADLNKCRLPACLARLICISERRFEMTGVSLGV